MSSGSDREVNSDKETWPDHGTVEKAGNDRTEVLHDHDVIGGRNMSREEAMHLGELTPEELEIEKRLVKKTDRMIMPLVMLVRRPFCYPFRQVQWKLTSLPSTGLPDELHRPKQYPPSTIRDRLHKMLTTFQTMLRLESRDWRQISTCKETNVGRELLHSSQWCNADAASPRQTKSG